MFTLISQLKEHGDKRNLKSISSLKKYLSEKIDLFIDDDRSKSAFMKD
jgi:hypothetical protein